MPKVIDFDFKFICATTKPVIDVRSPSEYKQGHIPGCINIPILNDDERHLVGINYKKGGRDSAIELGYKLVGHKFDGYCNILKQLTNSNDLIIHCWRGGLRSQIMAEYFESKGFNVQVLAGGYKTYRNIVLSSFDKPWKFKVIGGFTGSGKTELLNLLNNSGQQIIDLEALANHKGSVFGGLGQPEQKRNEHFENLLASKLGKLNLSKTIWIEDESRNIGMNQIPDAIFNLIRSADLHFISIPKDIRIKRIEQEYGEFPIKKLEDYTTKLRKRLGNLNLKLATDALENGDIKRWIGIMLLYYDKLYAHGLSKREPEKIKHIELVDDQFSKHIHKIVIE